MDISVVLGALGDYFETSGKNDQLRESARLEADLYAWKRQVDIDTEILLKQIADENDNKSVARQHAAKLKEIEATGEMYVTKANAEAGVNPYTRDESSFFKSHQEAVAAGKSGEREKFDKDLYENLSLEAERKRSAFDTAAKSGDMSKADLFRMKQEAEQAGVMANNYLATFGQRYGQQAQAAPQMQQPKAASGPKLSETMGSAGYQPIAGPAQAVPTPPPPASTPAPQKPGFLALMAGAGTPQHHQQQAQQQRLQNDHQQRLERLRQSGEINNHR